MDDLWTLSMPWWHFVARGALAYFVLLIMLRRYECNFRTVKNLHRISSWTRTAIAWILVHFVQCVRRVST